MAFPGATAAAAGTQLSYLCQRQWKPQRGNHHDWTQASSPSRTSCMPHDGIVFFTMSRQRSPRSCNWVQHSSVIAIIATLHIIVQHKKMRVVMATVNAHEHNHEEMHAHSCSCSCSLSLPCHGVVWSNDKCRLTPSLQWIADMHPWIWRTTGPLQGAMKLPAMQYHGQGKLKDWEQRQALERARSQSSPEADQRLKPNGSSSLSNPSSRGEGTTSPVTPMKPMMSWPTRTTIHTLTQLSTDEHYQCQMNMSL